MRLVVLIPAFNDRPALDRTLASLAEDLHPFDVLIVDDGSVPPLDVPAAAGAHQVVTLRLDVNGGIARALNAGRRVDAGAGLRRGRPARRRRPEPAEPARPAGRLPRAASRRGAGGWLDAPRRRADAPALRDALSRAVGGDCALGEDYELFWRLALRFPCANLSAVVVTRVEAARSLTHANRLAMAWSRLRLQSEHFTWRRLDCWLGIGRSVALLAVPVWLRLTMKRIARTVG